ncbi:Exocyst complex component 4 [Liparis tanakae]|uniref:Exocyst complex component Sec8 n=1 Tax=Liparis tanakae TaxID=230148 RepID=A0A4Z2IED7_9TELE|nr:Exocyst complex component 4 [Liparis tanakae]
MTRGPRVPSASASTPSGRGVSGSETSALGAVVSLSVNVKFIQEIEMNMGPGQAKQCQLRAFLTYYINDLFLNQVRTEINKEIEAVSKAADPLKILANADTMKVLGVQRPLLQSLIVITDSDPSSPGSGASSRWDGAPDVSWLSRQLGTRSR